jgi:Toprim domain-containing protein
VDSWFTAMRGATATIYSPSCDVSGWLMRIAARTPHPLTIAPTIAKTASDGSKSPAGFGVPPERRAEARWCAISLAGVSTIPLPPSLRWAPALRRPDGTHRPAMIARIDSIDGELIGIARTWLARDAAGNWCRLDRAMLGRAAGGAVWLASAANAVLIGEGIETTLAGVEATGLPGWAALSTSGMVALILPPKIRNVIILADHDLSGAGERAARIAETHWRREGRRVSVWMSPRPCEDANDCLLAALGAERRDVAA